LVCTSEEQILAVARQLLADPGGAGEGRLQVLRLKNRFRNPTPAGFRDLNVSLILPSG
jgi:hypothetical protein